MRQFFLAILLLSGTAQAEVYKCVTAGKTTYTDKPCAPHAPPAALPPVTAIQSSESDDLARRHDERLLQGKKARDEADARFVKSHAEKTERAHRVRDAIIDHEVIKGMTPSEVDSALGPADEVLPDGTRRYRQNGQRTTVRFEDGAVSHISITQERRKK